MTSYMRSGIVCRMMPTLYVNEYINDGKNVQHPIAQSTPLKK